MSVNFASIASKAVDMKILVIIAIICMVLLQIILLFDVDIFNLESGRFNIVNYWGQNIFIQILRVSMILLTGGISASFLIKKESKWISIFMLIISNIWVSVGFSMWRGEIKYPLFSGQEILAIIATIAYYIFLIKTVRK